MNMEIRQQTVYVSSCGKTFLREQDCKDFEKGNALTVLSEHMNEYCGSKSGNTYYDDTAEYIDRYFNDIKLILGK